MESCSFRTATSPSPFSSAPSSSSSPRAPCPNLRFARERNGRQMRMRRRASGFDAFPPLPGKVFVEETIGAEYGEGFETFRMDGPLNIDVDYLNEKLQECFLQRIRHAMKPDEAFGLIFSWDNVIADTDSLKLDAWRQLALEEGKDIPTAAHIQRSILHGAADHVLRKVLYWAKEDDQMDRLKARLIELYYESLFKLDTPVEGLREWLDAVRTAGIPCAVASSLDRRCMVEALDRMSLSKYFKRERNGRQMRMRRRASGFDAFPPLPGKVFVEETIGAEYGEGFETFRMDGPLNIDVDYLNEKLQEYFLQRIRHAMKPDEAFGLIFSWDNVIADTDSLKLDAWSQLALEEGKDIPTAAHIQRSILHGAADHVLRKVLYWAKEDDQMDRLKARLIELYYESLFKLDTPVEGLREWLDAVRTAGIPCAVASSLDRRCMVEALDRMSLSKYFKAIVTDEDDMESIAHRFLSAAVKIGSPQNAVFEDDPRGVTAAHNCTMMAVSLIGAHPAYELEQADLAVAKYNDLSVINLRRLFAHKGISFMDMQKQIIERSPPKRKLTVDTIF